MDKKVLYLNIVVQDASEAVVKKVKEKFRKSSLPGPLKSVMAKRAAIAASGIASPPMIASMMSDKVPAKLISKLKGKGIIAEVEEAFREGPYLVFQVQVVKVDAVALAKSRTKTKSCPAEATNSSAMSVWVENCLWLVGAHNQKTVEEDFLPEIVQNKLESVMGELLSEKLQAKDIYTEIMVLGEEKQSRYFFEKHKEIQSLRPAAVFPTRRRSTSSIRSRMEKTTAFEAVSEVIRTA